MKTKKVVFLTGWPLSPQIEERFTFQDIRDHGFDFELWDVSNLVHGPTSNQFGTSSTPRPWARQIRNQTEFKRALSDEGPETVVIDFLNAFIEIDWRVFSIYRELQRAGIRLFVMEFGAIPTWEGTGSSLGNRIIQKLRPQEAWSWLSRKMISRLRRHNYWVPRPDKVFAPTPDPVDYFLKPLAMGPERLVTCHSLDYHSFLKSKSKPKSKRLVEGPYAVFTWPNYVASPDAAIYDKKAGDLSEYNRRFNELFAAIEAELGLKVVISCHPRSRQGDNPFGRPLFYGQIMELARDCSLFITSGSTSVNFAVLYSRPILLAYTSDILYQNAFPGLPNRMGALLQSPSILLGHQKVPFSQLLRPSEELSKTYEGYKYTYTTARGKDSMGIWDILVSELRKEVENG